MTHESRLARERPRRAEALLGGGPLAPDSITIIPVPWERRHFPAAPLKNKTRRLLRGPAGSAKLVADYCVSSLSANATDPGGRNHPVPHGNGRRGHARQHRIHSIRTAHARRQLIRTALDILRPSPVRPDRHRIEERHHRAELGADLFERLVLLLEPCRVEVGPPASCSAIHALANVPSWISARMRFISRRVSSVMIRGPAV